MPFVNYFEFTSWLFHNIWLQNTTRDSLALHVIAEDIVHFRHNPMQQPSTHQEVAAL